MEFFQVYFHRQKHDSPQMDVHTFPVVVLSSVHDISVLNLLHHNIDFSIFLIYFALLDFVWILMLSHERKLSMKNRTLQSFFPKTILPFSKSKKNIYLKNIIVAVSHCVCHIRYFIMKLRCERANEQR